VHAVVVSERDALRRELEHKEWELAQKDKLLHETREALQAQQQLVAAIRARQHAEAEVSKLHRLREIARAAERDPATPLQ
jgi:hypothetical protein